MFRRNIFCCACRTIVHHHRGDCAAVGTEVEMAAARKDSAELRTSLLAAFLGCFWLLFLADRITAWESCETYVKRPPGGENTAKRNVKRTPDGQNTTKRDVKRTPDGQNTAKRDVKRAPDGQNTAKHPRLQIARTRQNAMGNAPQVARTSQNARSDLSG